MLLATLTMNWLVVVTLAAVHQSMYRHAMVSGTCASIGYSTACCPPDAMCLGDCCEDVFFCVFFCVFFVLQSGYYSRPWQLSVCMCM